MANTPVPAELAALRDRFSDAQSCPDDDLPSLWAAVMLRMRDQGLIRGHGSVPGELAESLICRWYGGKLSSQSTADVDVVTPQERLIQVKALRYTDPTRSSVASFGRPIAFDELAIVRFEYNMHVRDALLLDSRLLRVADEEGPGLLTPAGMRLSLGPRVEEAAHRVPPEELWQQAGGTSWDNRQARPAARG